MRVFVFMSMRVCVHLCVSVSMCVCARAWVRGCVRACVLLCIALDVYALSCVPCVVWVQFCYVHLLYPVQTYPVVVADPVFHPPTPLHFACYVQLSAIFISHHFYVADTNLNLIVMATATTAAINNIMAVLLYSVIILIG